MAPTCIYAFIICCDVIGQSTLVELIGYSPSVLIGAFRSAFDAGSTRLFTLHSLLRKIMPKIRVIVYIKTTVNIIIITMIILVYHTYTNRYTY